MEPKTIPTAVMYHRCPLGMLRLEANGRGLCAVRLCGAPPPCPGQAEAPSPVLQAAATQLDEYFAGQRRSFALPLAPQGTPFQQRVWAALCQIPYGETRTYGQVAAMAGNPRACRAVGMANHANPLMIVVPCHRVIGKNGGLTGYACGLEVKRALLALERGG